MLARVKAERIKFKGSLVLRGHSVPFTDETTVQPPKQYRHVVETNDGVDKHTIVLILSDGLDTGDAEILEGAMDELAIRAGKVIWLNPLLGSKDYRPLARGMSTALRHIDVFAPAHNLASLQDLGRHLTL